VSVAEGEDEEKKGEEEGEAQTASEEEPEQSKADEWRPYIPEVASKVCWAHYSSPDTFWVSMDAYDAGYLYECRFVSEPDRAKVSASALSQLDEPFGAVPVLQSDLTGSEDIPLSCMTLE